MVNIRYIIFSCILSVSLHGMHNITDTSYEVIAKNISSFAHMFNFRRADGPLDGAMLKQHVVSNNQLKNHFVNLLNTQPSDHAGMLPYVNYILNATGYERGQALGTTTDILTFAANSDTLQSMIATIRQHANPQASQPSASAAPSVSPLHPTSTSTAPQPATQETIYQVQAYTEIAHAMGYTRETKLCPADIIALKGSPDQKVQDALTLFTSFTRGEIPPNLETCILNSAVATILKACGFRQSWSSFFGALHGIKNFTELCADKDNTAFNNALTTIRCINSNLPLQDYGVEKSSAPHTPTPPAPQPKQPPQVKKNKNKGNPANHPVNPAIPPASQQPQLTPEQQAAINAGVNRAQNALRPGGHIDKALQDANDAAANGLRSDPLCTIPVPGLASFRFYSSDFAQLGIWGVKALNIGNLYRNIVKVRVEFITAHISDTAEELSKMLTDIIESVEQLDEQYATASWYQKMTGQYALQRHTFFAPVDKYTQKIFAWKNYKKFTTEYIRPILLYLAISKGAQCIAGISCADTGVTYIQETDTTTHTTSIAPLLAVRRGIEYTNIIGTMISNPLPWYVSMLFDSALLPTTIVLIDRSLQKDLGAYIEQHARELLDLLRAYQEQRDDTTREALETFINNGLTRSAWLPGYSWRQAVGKQMLAQAGLFACRVVLGLIQLLN